MRPYADETEADGLRRDMGSGASEIAEILPELRTKLGGLERPHALVPEQARFQLFLSITTFLKKLSQAQPLILVLDDLHWADESSLHLIEFLVHEINGSRILVIGAYRETEITGRHALTETLGSLVRQDNFSRVQLSGLNSQEVGELIMSNRGSQLEKMPLLPSTNGRMEIPCSSEKLSARSVRSNWPETWTGLTRFPEVSET